MYRPHLDFAVELHKALPATGNLPWSPYSVASALGIAAAGARGRTFDEFAAALAPNGDLEEVGRMLAASAEVPEAEIAVANALWMRLGMVFHEAYQDTVLGWPGGALRTADFRADPDGSRQKINGEVEDVTHGLITDLIPDGLIDADTAAVIVNALYLKVAWQHPFEASETSPAPFRAPSGTRDVPTMGLVESMPYAAVAGWHMVTLVTEGDVVMDVLLPSDDAGDLSSDAVAELQSAASSRKVELRLPRFRIEADVPLVEPMRTLGVEDAFSRVAADFYGISDEFMYVDAVLHKAVLDVDEQGFEGAAATAVIMRLTSMDLSKPVPFYVDRPFYVLIRHRRTGAIYFLARIDEP